MLTCDVVSNHVLPGTECHALRSITYQFCDAAGEALYWDQILPESWKEEYDHYYYARHRNYTQEVSRVIEEMYPEELHPLTLDSLYKLWSILDNIAQSSDDL